MFLKNPQGETVWVDDANLKHAIDTGYTQPGTQEAANAITAPEAQGQGVGGAVTAAATSLASGATLGLSDIALRGLLSKGSTDYVADSRNAHPLISGTGQILGAVGAAVATGGESLAADAAGLAPAAGLSRVAGGLSEALGGGVVGGVASGALEGSVMNAGNYLSEVALDDKELSSEAFIAAAKSGGLWGGLGGGTLGAMEKGTIAARRMFAKSTFGDKAAVDIAESKTFDAIDESIAQSRHLEQIAKQRMAEANAERTVAKAAADKQAAEIKLGATAKKADYESQMQALRLAKAQGKKIGAESGVTSPAAVDAVTAPAEVEAASGAAVEDVAAKHEIDMHADEANAHLVKHDNEVADLAAATQELASAREGLEQLTAKQRPLTLEEQLQGTKQALDEGKALKDIKATESTQRPPEVELPPLGQRMSKEQMDAWKSRMKAMSEANAQRKGFSTSYEDSFTGAPIAEGGLNPRRIDRLTTPTAEAGTAENASQKFLRSRTTIEKVMDEGWPKRSNLPESDPEALIHASRIQAKERGRALSEDTVKAFRAKYGGGPIVAEVAEAIPVITRYENAVADVARKLGPAAPPEAAALAQSLDEAAAATEAKVATKTAEHVDAQAVGQPKLTQEVEKTPKIKQKGLLEKALDLSSIMHVVGLPSLSALPVVGPLLGAYLKVRAVKMAWQRMGGRVADSIETRVAVRQAEMRDKVAKSVDALFASAEKGISTARQNAGYIIPKSAEILGDRLFHHDDSKDEPGSTTSALAMRRAEELSHAVSNPDAVHTAVMQAVPLSDPDMQDAIVAAQIRKLDYLQKNAPKANPADPFGRQTAQISAAQVEQFARRVRAAEDPTTVLDDVAHGHCTYEAAETLREVYPRIYSMVQTRLLEQSVKQDSGLPYRTQLQLSVLFHVPLTSGLRNLQTLQASSQAVNGQQAAPAAPTGNPVRLSELYQTPDQRRAAH